MSYRIIEEAIGMALDTRKVFLNKITEWVLR